MVFVNGSGNAVYPAKAQGFLNGIIVRDAWLPGVFARINEPDFCGGLVVFLQPLPPGFAGADV
jgi:hypothetical protein